MAHKPHRHVLKGDRGGGMVAIVVIVLGQYERALVAAATVDH